MRAWLEGTSFEAKAGRSALLPDADGAPGGALLLLSDPPEPWDFAALRERLPAGDWRLEPADGLDLGQAALGWALASYRFDRYRKNEAKPVRLAVAAEPAIERANATAEAIFLARDLINTPAADLGPAELAEAAAAVAGRFGAEFATIEDQALLDRNYPAVYAVGQASTRPPRLIDLTWGEAGAPKLTLVGKGVCFDTGGLDLKPSSGMQLMKKDMGGAAITLGLAQVIMALALPVRLRLLIGAVENSVSGSSFRPGDILRTRKGLTVEVGNTDAEGRLVLADLLAEADRERPALLIDCATLTGAARVALGPDLPALFTPDDALADDSARGRTERVRAALAVAAAPPLSGHDRQPDRRPQQCRQVRRARRDHGGAVPGAFRHRDQVLGASGHLRVEFRGPAGAAEGRRGDRSARPAPRHRDPLHDLIGSSRSVDEGSRRGSRARSRGDHARHAGPAVRPPARSDRSSGSGRQLRSAPLPKRARNRGWLEPVLLSGAPVQQGPIVPWTESALMFASVSGFSN